MPITIKQNLMKYKSDLLHKYVGINSVAERATADQIEDIEAAGADTISEVNAAIEAGQTAIDGIEAQKNQMISAIASVAGAGTDKTLSTTDVAADAKVTGDRIGDLEIGITHINDTLKLCIAVEHRKINTNNAKTIESDKHLMTDYIPSEVGYSISVGTGWKFDVAGYASNLSETYSARFPGLTTTTFNQTFVNAYPYFRICFYKDPLVDIGSMDLYGNYSINFDLDTESTRINDIEDKLIEVEENRFRVHIQPVTNTRVNDELPDANNAEKNTIYKLDIQAGTGAKPQNMPTEWLNNLTSSHKYWYLETINFLHNNTENQYIQTLSDENNVIRYSRTLIGSTWSNWNTVDYNLKNDFSNLWTEKFTHNISEKVNADMAILTPKNVFLKDPTVFIHNGKFHMYASTSDDFSVTYGTAWLTSRDGLNWDYQKLVFNKTGVNGYAKFCQAATSKPVLINDIWHIWVTCWGTTNGWCIAHYTCNDLDNPEWIADQNNPVVTNSSNHILDPFIVYENGIYYMFVTHDTSEQVAYATSSDALSWSSFTDLDNVIGEGPMVIKAPNNKWRIFCARWGSSKKDEAVVGYESDNLTGPYTSTGLINTQISSWANTCYGHGDILFVPGGSSISPKDMYYMYFQTTPNNGDIYGVGIRSSIDCYNFDIIKKADYGWADFWAINDGVLTSQGYYSGYYQFVRRWDFHKDFELNVKVQLVNSDSVAEIILFGENTPYTHAIRVEVSRSQIIWMQDASSGTTTWGTYSGDHSGWFLITLGIKDGIVYLSTKGSSAVSHTISGTNYDIPYAFALGAKSQKVVSYKEISLSYD